MQKALGGYLEYTYKHLEHLRNEGLLKYIYNYSEILGH